MIFLIILFISLVSCELFVIGKKEVKRVSIDRGTAVGTIHIFKAELESNNIHAAVQMMVDSTGEPLLAMHKYELYNEMERLRRIIGDKTVTKVEKDSISPVHYNVKMEFNKTRTILFRTTRLKNTWFISGYK